MPTEHLLLYSPFNRGHWRQSNHKKSFLQENTAVIYIHGNETWCQARLSPFTEHPPPFYSVQTPYLERSYTVDSSDIAELVINRTGQTVKTKWEWPRCLTGPSLQIIKSVKPIVTDYWKQCRFFTSVGLSCQTGPPFVRRQRVKLRKL